MHNMYSINTEIEP